MYIVHEVNAHDQCKQRIIGCIYESSMRVCPSISIMGKDFPNTPPPNYALVHEFGKDDEEAAAHDGLSYTVWVWWKEYDCYCE